MNNYEARKEAKRERYAELAQKAQARADGLYKSGTQALEAIPFGQPILVGHHSERRDRNYRSKAVGQIDRSFEESNKAEYYADKAENYGTNGISSDDPEAVEKLKIKLAKLEDFQTNMKEANAEARANKVEQPYAKYQLTNNGANIRTVKQRIERLSKAQETEARPDIKGNGWTLHENKEENRIQFLFESIPSEEVRSLLKSHGFRWSPFNKAWQRQLNFNGWYSAQQFIIPKL